jgi:hypothetical protein
MGATGRKTFISFRIKELQQDMVIPTSISASETSLCVAEVYWGNQLPVIANWEHILNLYRLDIPNMIHLLC